MLREPQPLRTLAELTETTDPGRADALLDHLVALWARPLSAGARSLIKASSSCNALVAPLLERRLRDRVVLMDLPLTAYLATVLKSEAARVDVAAAAHGRMRALAAFAGEAGAQLAGLDTPELCAMGWLAEQVRFRDLATGAHGDRVLRVDFETLLAAPRDTLSAIAAHLQLPAAQLDAAMHSPWWRRYSKAGAHAYAAEDRQHDLDLSRQRFGAAIHTAQDWLGEFLRRHPGLADRAGL